MAIPAVKPIPALVDTFYQPQMYDDESSQKLSELMEMRSQDGLSHQAQNISRCSRRKNTKQFFFFEFISNEFNFVHTSDHILHEKSEHDAVSEIHCGDIAGAEDQ